MPSAGDPVTWAAPERARQFEAWLHGLSSSQGLDAGSVSLASADASFRRYFRVQSGDGTRIIMDAPPDKENCQPFVQVARLMDAAGLKVPRILDWDEGHGFMLLTDLGQQTMMQAMDPADAQACLPFYRQAIDALVQWQLASRPGVLPPYDDALLQRELTLFPDWYVAQHRGVAVEGKLRETLARMSTLIVERCLAWPQVFVHRDFMPRNLMVPLPGDSDLRLGVLDFQDAVYGPITYDIASLMRDAFLSWDEDMVLDVTVRYWQQARKAGLPVGDDFGEFYRGVEWMGLQRHLKVAGIFARLTLRDGKLRYLADAPRFIAYIRATCSRYIELKPLLRLVDEIEGIQEPTGFAFGRV